VKQRTRPGRLAHLDAVLGAEAWAAGARVVDLGFGATPVTTLELRAALPAHVEVVGVEADPDAVARALASERPGLRFVVGGFALPPEARPATVIRAMNVLRGYPASACAGAREALADALVEGGRLIEGTCGPAGEVSVTGWHRRRGDALVLERMLFSTAFARGFAPLVFRDRLPRDLRGYRPESALGGLFRDWAAAYAAIAPTTPDPRARFVAAAARLAGMRPDVPPADWAAGQLWWTTTGA
jgi:hypothetical protein